MVRLEQSLCSKPTCVYAPATAVYTWYKRNRMHPQSNVLPLLRVCITTFPLAGALTTIQWSLGSLQDVRGLSAIYAVILVLSATKVSGLYLGLYGSSPWWERR